MSLSGASAWSTSIWATIPFADASSTSVPRNTIRSRSSREKMSKERSKRPSGSPTIGTSWDTASPSSRNMQPVGCTIYATNRLRVRGGAAMQVEREIVFPESPAELWEALTEPRRLEEWFASEVSLDAQPGGSGVFRWGDGDERRATVREAAREERLVLDWEDGGEVVLELEEIEGGTRLHVIESTPEFATALALRA